MTDAALFVLEEWYASHLDGEWEHSFGVEISTLDNPGWSVVIDLNCTLLESRQMPPIRIERSETDWFECRVETHCFRGFGGARNLKDILAVFLDWKSSIQRLPAA